MKKVKLFSTGKKVRRRIEDPEVKAKRKVERKKRELSEYFLKQFQTRTEANYNYAS